MDAESERAAVARVLGQTIEGGAVEESRGEIAVEERWRPTHTEREALARYAVLGIGADEIAGKLGKSLGQVKYALKGEKQEEYEDKARESANTWVGFAMAQLQLAAPESVNNMLRVIRDPQHRDNVRATIWHLDTVLAPVKQAPEEKHDFTISLSKQATETLMEGILGYRKQRLGANSQGTDGIRGLRQGNDAFIDSRVGMDPTDTANQRLDIEGKVVEDDGL